MTGLTFQLTFNLPSEGKGEPDNFFGYNEGPKKIVINKHWIVQGHSSSFSISPHLIKSKTKRFIAKTSPFGLVSFLSSLLWELPDKVIRRQRASGSYADHCIIGLSGSLLGADRIVWNLPDEKGIAWSSLFTLIFARFWCRLRRKKIGYLTHSCGWIGRMLLLRT